MANDEERHTTLVTRFSALGDVAMTLPVIYNVARSNPERDFLLLTRPNPARMFINHPDNLTVKGIDLNLEGSPADMVQLCNRLAGEYDIDTYADLHDVLRTKIMRMVMKVKGVRCAHIDKMRSRRRALTRKSGKRLTQLPPVGALYADVFSRLGINRTKSFTSLFGSEGADISLLRPVIGEIDSRPDDEKWIAIAPFARHKGKIYPPDKMTEVIRHYAGRDNVKIFLLGAGDAESEILQQMASSADNIINVAALHAGLETELALFSHCDAMLSMDSANMHLASLTGCPVVSIWGATHPFTGFYGRGQNREDAIQLALPCRPCSIYGNKPCLRGDYLCLTGISPQLITVRLDKICAL